MKDISSHLPCPQPYKWHTTYCHFNKIPHEGNALFTDEVLWKQFQSRFQTYNSGVASVFEVPSTDARDMSVDYIGVLKDILKLDYGPLHTPIILFRCQWVKTTDNRGNRTYVRDDAGFLIVNFRHKLPRMAEPFIFASQATQVFFSDVPSKPGWKAVLQKETRAKREVLDSSDVFISTTIEANGLRAPEDLPTPPQIPSLIGAIDLSPEENLLAQAGY